MRQSLFVIGAVCILAIGGCETAGNQQRSYYDEPFKKVEQPHTTAFKYIRNFSGQRVALGQVGDVRTIRYYQGGSFVGRTQFVLDAWFERFSENEMKQRLMEALKRKFPLDNAPSQALSTYRKFEDFGVYTEKNGCLFMSFYKRLKGSTGYDNDYGAPDFVGLFAICGGLTVTPEKFMESIDQAKESDSAAFKKATN